MQGAIKQWLANGAYRGLEFIHARARRYPAGFHMQLGHALIVVVQESQKILGQIALVKLAE